MGVFGSAGSLARVLFPIIGAYVYARAFLLFGVCCLRYCLCVCVLNRCVGWTPFVLFPIIGAGVRARLFGGGGSDHTHRHPDSKTPITNAPSPSNHQNINNTERTHTNTPISPHKKNLNNHTNIQKVIKTNNHNNQKNSKNQAGTWRRIWATTRCSGAPPFSWACRASSSSRPSAFYVFFGGGGLGVVWVYGWMHVCVVISISCGVFGVRLAWLGGWLYALCVVVGRCVV